MLKKKTSSFLEFELQNIVLLRKVSGVWEVVGGGGLGMGHGIGGAGVDVEEVPQWIDVRLPALRRSPSRGGGPAPTLCSSSGVQ
jgi:hypothetical protein